MIRVGNILIDPDSIDTVLNENKGHLPDKQRGIHYIQIIYKSGVVKNITSQEIGMSYPDFINELMEAKQKAEDRKIFKLMAAIQSRQN